MRLSLAGLFLAPVLLAGGGVSAESLSCRSFNGNVTCAGPGANACQTVNGQTTCTSGGGAVVQRFGGRSVAPPVVLPPEEAEELEAMPPLRRTGPAGWMTIERDGSRLRLRSDRLSIDRD